MDDYYEKIKDLPKINEIAELNRQKIIQDRLMFIEGMLILTKGIRPSDKKTKDVWL